MPLTPWMAATSNNNGTNAWTNPANAQQRYEDRDSNEASKALSSNTTGNQFYAFADIVNELPGTATINQVEVRSYCRTTGSGAPTHNCSVTLWAWDGGTGGAAYGAQLTLMSSPGGGGAQAAALRQTTHTASLPTAAQLRDTNFRVRMQAYQSGGGATKTSYLDTLEIRIDYSIGQTFTLNLAGAITPTGGIGKQAEKPLTASIGPAGAAAKTVSKPVAGLIDTSGAIARTVSKAVAGTIGPAGAITKAVSKVLDGLTGPAGAVSKAVGKAVAGVITAAGDLAATVLPNVPPRVGRAKIRFARPGRTRLRRRRPPTLDS